MITGFHVCRRTVDDKRREHDDEDEKFEEHDAAAAFACHFHPLIELCSSSSPLYVIYRRICYVKIIFLYNPGIVMDGLEIV